MRKKQFISSLLLLLTAAIWGSAFVAQRVGMNYAGPFFFNAARGIIAAIVLLPVARLFRGKEPTDRRKTLIGGLLCGLAIFAATNLQQAGLIYTAAGKAGFITTFYIILVPVLGLFLKKRTGVFTWLAVALAFCGLYCLCMGPGSFALELGDLLLLLCALFYAVQILLVDRYVPGADCVMLSCIQFAVSGVLSLITALLVETPDVRVLLQGWAPLLYAGILSSGVAYTLQIIGQKDLSPTVASLLMSLESVFAVLAGWLLLKEQLSGRELLGCALMFAAVALVQLAPQKAEIKASGSAEA